MHIIMFVAGLLLVLVTLYVWWVFKPDKRLAAYEAEAFRREAERANTWGDLAIARVYQADAAAEARGEGFIPSWIYALGLIIGCLLMAPAVMSWL
ncbi:MAG: hypothetical protein WC763_00995 [Candidatus Paceibacterota bacterium]